MTWDSKKLIAAISANAGIISNNSDFIFLPLFDTASNIGVGNDGQGRTVLVLPGQQDVIAFQTEFAEFDPWVDLTLAESGEQLQGAAVLRCDIKKGDFSTIEAAAAIFLGIIDLQKIFGNCGKAIWQMKALFENRLLVSISDAKITGLIGEILTILSASNSNIAIKFWHSDIDDKFDFSGSKFRLEVKSTVTQTRIHNFSSFQLPGNEKTYVASLLINKVESGTSFADVFDLLISKLDVTNQQKASEIVLKTLGVPAGWCVSAGLPPPAPVPVAYPNHSPRPPPSFPSACPTANFLRVTSEIYGRSGTVCPDQSDSVTLQATLALAPRL